MNVAAAKSRPFRLPRGHHRPLPCGNGGSDLCRRGTTRPDWWRRARQRRGGPDQQQDRPLQPRPAAAARDMAVAARGATKRPHAALSPRDFHRPRSFGIDIRVRAAPVGARRGLGGSFGAHRYSLRGPFGRSAGGGLASRVALEPFRRRHRRGLPCQEIAMTQAPHARNDFRFVVTNHTCKHRRLR
jgi:hypothetical protein